MNDQDIESVERAVRQLPAVARVDRAARTLSARLRRLCPDSRLWIRYEDLRLLQRVVRQQRFYAAGYELGRAIGVTEARAGAATRTPAARALRHALRRLTLDGRLRRTVAAAILVEIAHGLLVAPGVARRRSATPAGSPRRRR